MGETTKIFDINFEDMAVDLAKEVKGLEQERDTLISVLKECVVALGGAMDGYDTEDLEQFKGRHPGCAAGEICIWDVLSCHEALTHAKSTLSKYER